MKILRENIDNYFIAGVLTAISVISAAISAGLAFYWLAVAIWWKA